MRIGMAIGMYGGPADGPRESLRWTAIRDRALAAEEADADIVVIEDAFYYRDEDEAVGYWEPMATAAALAVATSSIVIGHSVINAPYRTPVLTAQTAETLDEISGGRYTLGIGRGNVAEMDYRAAGVAADHRTDRFEEALAIIHGLLKEGRVDVDGTYWSAHEAELVLRGPRPGGPPIVVAARGPRMMRLAARYGDGWNWWCTGPDELGQLGEVVADLERACDAVDRDPATLDRSLDVYSLDPLNLLPDRDDIIRGSPDEVAEQLLAVGELGFAEVRCKIAHPQHLAAAPLEAFHAMREVIEAVHAA